MLAGWLFYGNEWATEPFIRVKGSALRKQMGLESHSAMANFFVMGQYTLGPLIEEYYQGNTDKVHQQALDVDRKLMLVMELRHAASLHLLPYTTPHGVTTWYAPTDTLPQTMNHQQALYIRSVFSLMAQDVAPAVGTAWMSFSTRWIATSTPLAGAPSPQPHATRPSACSTPCPSPRCSSW